MKLAIHRVTFETDLFMIYFSGQESKTLVLRGGVKFAYDNISATHALYTNHRKYWGYLYVKCKDGELKLQMDDTDDPFPACVLNDDK